MGEMVGDLGLALKYKKKKAESRDEIKNGR